MTISEHLLIHIYATQKVYQTRVLEMVCAMHEQMEKNAEPTGLLFAMAEGDTAELVNELVRFLKASHPENSPFLKDQPITDEVIQTWIDTAAKTIMDFTDDDKKG